ncbi:SsgA family sporulation/cell division regulator [Streptomyces sp. AV19]|uniref:SsgA family sporulation/cell division regulator n=1 Tax=Streptomyces sp. AV19 TaxID=2793068 RepID=UPI0018FEA359|nr:SsgA family sporulation/cell division regulator [Streptomyces sp. AV19]MBH1939091.1 SsgA family sporulation/cell division regulator [Streptomyces sp. AV19]MDG4536937.1 SsgA family sporulation/cell division regulator [Streptomyces sp. AV19]
MKLTHAVTCEMEMELFFGEDVIPVAATFEYHSSTPYEITVVLSHGQQIIAVWNFARNLLMQGVSHPSGIGDVRVWPDSENGKSVLYLGLHGAQFSTLLRARLSDIIVWNTRTQQLVPLGYEHLHADIAEELAALLSE